MRKRRTVLAAAILLTAVGVVVPTRLAAAVAGVDPATVELTLAAGASSTFTANLTTPVIAPDPDIVFLADTTGSMDPALANVRNNLPSIMAEVRAAQPNARFGIAEYKEQRDGPRVFRVNTPLTTEDDAVVAGAQDWLYGVGGGGQPQTDFLNAQFQLATGAVPFRPDGSRVIAWFGDARSNDPSLGHTRADTVNALRANGIRVVAVPVTGTPAPGLDELGQATSVTGSTGGVLMPGQGAGDVAAAILNGIQALAVPVRPVPACDPQLTLTADPPTRTVSSGTVAEFAETVTVRPDAAAGTYRCTVDFQVNGLSAGYTQTVTVHVPGAEPRLRISDVTVDEGDSGTTPATLTVSLDRAATSDVTVAWATEGDSGDFTPGSGSLTFAAGETSKQLTVAVTGDLLDEPDETFTVRLSQPSGAVVEDGEGVVTIRDDDEPGTLPLLRISDAAVPESDADTSGTLTVSLDRPSTGTVTVDWATVAGTAGPADFTEASGTVTFTPGQTTRPLPVTVRGDDLVEQTETFTVRLSGAAGATLDDADGVVTVLDDDDTTPGELPRVRIGDAAGPEGNTGTTPATLTVTLDKPSTTPVTVQWATEPGTAGADDFTAASGELTFAPGEVSEQLSVAVLGDRAREAAETFAVRLTGASGAVVADDSGTCTITDDDGSTPGEVPELRIGDVSVPEGVADATPATVTVVLDQASLVPVTVRWATEPGTAGTDDFTAGGDVLEFAPGQTSTQITVPVVGDRAAEEDETFAVRLSEAGNATIADGSAVVTVVNDDSGGPELSVEDVTVAEDAGQAAVTVRLSAVSAEPVSVRVATVEGSASDPADYAGVDTRVTFEPGATTVSVPVAVVADAVPEGDETFAVTLSSPTGATIGDAAAVVTIRDGGGDLPVVSVDDTSVAENGGAAVFPVRLTKAPATPVTVRWATAEGTATGADFTGGTGEVTFAPGAVTASVEVPVVDDAAIEGDESFELTLSAPSGATLGDAAAAGVILDDDDSVVRPVLSVTDASVREDGGPAVFEVRLSEAATGPVSVAWATGDGTAVAPGDYTGGAGRVSFAPGEVSAPVEVPVTEDTAPEGDETFTLTLTDPVGATVGDGTAVGTIVDVAASGTFTCAASAADLLGTRPAVAGGDPCATDARSAARLRLNLGLLTVTVDGLTAATTAAPGRVDATAGLLTTRISAIGLVIELGAVTSTATAACVAGPGGAAPVFTGSSRLAWLKINGVAVPIGSGPVTLPLLVGSLSLNSTVETADGLVQTAFELRTLLGNVVIGEAEVGATGNPC